jgi:3-hydroxyisobutyrate dehydrogenase
MSCDHAVHVLFVGLGRMGYAMAGRIAQRIAEPLYVCNRSIDVAQRHSSEFQSIVVDFQWLIGESSHDPSSGIPPVFDTVFLCLPTSQVVKSVVMSDGFKRRLHNERGLVIDCTSGVPSESQAIATWLSGTCNSPTTAPSCMTQDTDVAYPLFLDAPVSGGPRGAQAGTLTCMISGCESAVLHLPLSLPLSADIVRNHNHDQDQDHNYQGIDLRTLIGAFASNVVFVSSQVGAAHALKAINNTMNSAHLLLASEALLTLQKLGVAPSVALQVINNSSGRSLATQSRLPDYVLTRKFDYGFALALMAKDVAIGNELIRSHFPQASILSQVHQVLDAAVLQQGADADYTQVCV